MAEGLLFRGPPDRNESSAWTVRCSLASIVVPTPRETTSTTTEYVTWNNIPNGAGIVPGRNAELAVSFATGSLQSGDVVEYDVTADVLAWATGAPNYGWGVVPTGGNGTEIRAFEAAADVRPQLIVLPGAVTGPPLQAGDADMDLDFDQLDLVQGADRRQVPDRSGGHVGRRGLERGSRRFVRTARPRATACSTSWTSSPR